METHNQQLIKNARSVIIKELQEKANDANKALEEIVTEINQTTSQIKKDTR